MKDAIEYLIGVCLALAVIAATYSYLVNALTAAITDAFSSIH